MGILYTSGLRIIKGAREGRGGDAILTDFGGSGTSKVPRLLRMGESILGSKVRHEFLINLNSSHIRLGAGGGAMVRGKLYSGLQQKCIKAVEATGEGHEDTPPPPPVYLESPCLSARKWGLLCFIFFLFCFQHLPLNWGISPGLPPPTPIKNHVATTAWKISIWCSIIRGNGKQG